MGGKGREMECRDGDGGGTKVEKCRPCVAGWGEEERRKVKGGERQG